MKRTIFVAIVLGLVLTLGAQAQGAKKLKVTHIVRTNLGDKSFNDSAWSGVQRAGRELGLDVKVIEIGGDQTKYEPTFLDASESDADVVIVNSGAMSEVAEKYVGQFPKKKYIFFDMQPTFRNGYPNVLALSFKQNESSYLAGALAGLMTKTKNIGFVGGVENIIINDFMVGYINGALYANPSIKIQTALIGSFSDAAKGKELGLVQIQNGADFVHSVAGGAGLGVIDAVAEKKGVWSLGVDSDQAMVLKEKSPQKAEVIITSALKDVGAALYEGLKQIQSGSAKFGTVVRMGVKEGVNGYADNEYFQKNTTPAVKAKLKEIKDKIISGAIVVPSAFDMSQDQIVALKAKVKP